jgi:hypothetical protein
MAEEIKTDEKSEIAFVRQISESIDHTTFNKIINKLTDYAETLSEGKISGIINFNYRLNSIQTSEAVKLLEDIQGIIRIYSLSLKGSKDIEVEYISNIYSDYENPETISSYISLKNIIENRLTHQVQQYNINMGKNNTTLAIPVNELRGHVKTYRDLHGQNITISTKAQHGYIAASLHDAYTTLLNKPDYWNEKSYMKFFFNEDDQSKRKMLLLKREKRQSIREIAHNVRKILDRLQAMQQTRIHTSIEPISTETELPPSLEDLTRRSKSDTFTDRMLLTPFGRQYGSIIEKIITRTYDPERKKLYNDEWENAIKEKISPLFKSYKVKDDLTQYVKEITEVVEYLLMQEYGIKSFTEKFLYADRRESFSKYYTEYIQEHVEQFLSQLFNIYFEISFSSLFRIIKSADMKKFACAYIIKRIYIDEGENLTDFGFFFIRVIAKIGGIKSQ